MENSRLRVGLVILVVILGLTALGLWRYWRASSPQGEASTEKSMSTADLRSRLLEEDDIAETVFRYQFTQCFPDKNRELYFLFRDSRQDPSDAFMRRFDGHTPAVMKFSNSTERSDRVADKDSARYGLLLGVENIKWLDASSVEVTGICYADRENLLEYVYAVSREGTKWVVKQSTLTLMT